MRWWLGWGWLWVLGVLVGAPPTGADDTLDRLTEARGKADGVQSYQADFTVTVVEEGRPSTMTGTVVYQRPDKRRIEFTTTQPDAGLAQLVVSNGLFEWQYFPSAKVVYQTEWSKLKAGDVPAEALELRGLHQPFIDVEPETIRLVETATAGDQRLYVFEADPTTSLVEGAPFTPGKIRVEVGADDGLTRRLTMTNAQGREVLVQQYTNVQINVPVQAEQFAFTPPPEVQVVDVSEERAGGA